MPELQFKGKEFVYNHHLSVPFRPLIPDAEKSVGEPSLGGNLIIHGDNLHALKALLPMYAGKVDCVYIDPPYNTGNRDWSYKDDLSGPMFQAWRNDENTALTLDDLLRHDKWCAMMWPRLVLLKELLHPMGSIFISIDDNEIHRLRMMMDEIFSDSCFAAQITILCNPKGRGLSEGFADTHEYVLVYTCNADGADFSHAKSEELIAKEYKLTAEDGTKYRLMELRNTHREFGRHNRQKLWFPLFIDPLSAAVSLTSCNGMMEVWPTWDDGYEGCWTWNALKVALEGELLVGKKIDGRWKVFRIDRASGARRKPTTVWTSPDIQSEKGQEAFERVMGKRFSHPPKALGLLERILQIATTPESIVLDCFAGSGTTGHAVLLANTKDTGQRRFILVEGEAYADSITAERARRIIRGYPFKGSIREELMRETLTWTKIQNPQKLLDKVVKLQQCMGLSTIRYR